MSQELLDQGLESVLVQEPPLCCWIQPRMNQEDIPVQGGQAGTQQG